MAEFKGGWGLYLQYHKLIHDIGRKLYEILALMMWKHKKFHTCGNTIFFKAMLHILQSNRDQDPMFVPQMGSYHGHCHEEDFQQIL